jgi:beta-lactam-binding protein with PASTA domain
MGTHTVSVPSVTGQNSDTGQAALKAAGFAVQIASNYDTSTAAGTIMTQLPTVGSPATPGSVVGLTVSRGPAVAGSSITTVPPVVGKTVAKAKSALAKAHLKAIVVVWSGTSQPKGRVATQLPDVNFILTRKSKVIIFVSSGK